jgi:ribosome-associated protein
MALAQLRKPIAADEICQIIEEFLDQKKADDIVRINLAGKSSIADFMVIASGKSQRHIQATGLLLKDYLNEMGIKPIFIEGTDPCDWVLVDAGDVIVHLFRPEVRSHYNLEKMWGVDLADFSRKAAGEV